MSFKKWFSLLSILFLLLALPLTVSLVKKAQKYLSQALGKPANIVVETDITLGPLPRIWEALAQGGEETTPETLSPVVSQVAALRPRYLRLDHIFDFYGVVGGQNNGRMIYDFTRLDRLVEDILKTGAKPMFSLSYMPPVISSGDVTSPPVFWSDWREIVKTTIEHYSGRNQKNLTDVYYEVWNEPDLFGQWKIGRNPDYRLLYKYAVLGAGDAQNVNPFKIGGPGTTAAYQNWLDQFLEYIAAENLRLDFFSWHRYSLWPGVFADDVNQIDTWFAKHGGFYLLPKFLTEWGSSSEVAPIHDTIFDAVHLLATQRQLIGRVDLVFTFEIKDGPPPGQEKYWGRWGLLTHEKVGVSPKPKYQALVFLNQLRGEQLRISGEGTWVTGLAAKEGMTTRLILINYDPQGTHAENVPVSFTNLEDGTYRFSQTFLLGQRQERQVNLNGGLFSQTIFMPAESAALLELEKISP